MLFRFGMMAELVTKRAQYLIIYVVSGLVGNFASLYLLPAGLPSLGASGVIFGALAAAMIGRWNLTADNIAIAAVFIGFYL